MAKKKSKDSSEVFPVILMGGLFVLIHCLALLVTAPFVEAGVQPAFKDPDNPMNILFIFVILLVFTVIILLIAKFWKKQLIQVIILGAIGYTAAYLVYPLFTLVIPQTTSARIALSNNYYIVISLSAIFAIVFGNVLTNRLIFLAN